MNGLLDVATVIRDGDAHWKSSYELDGLQCGLSSSVTDVCLPSSGNELAGDSGGGPRAYRVGPFGVVVELSERSAFCSTEEQAKILNDSVEAETEKAAGSVLWYGIGSTEAWLGDSSVYSVAPGADTKASVAAALIAFHRHSVGLEPILHLGIGAAINLSSSGLVDDDGKLKTFGHPVVVNPMYPSDGVAVTGPIVIHVDEPQVIQGFNPGLNRITFEAVRLADLGFDTCGAVVVGDLPLRVYSTQPSPLTVRLYGGEFGDSATVDWGDGSADGTLEAEAGSYVDHTYDDPGSYQITVTDGDRSRTVTVAAKE